MNSDKKTILVLTTFYYKRGGAEIIVYEEIKRLTNKFNFIILTTKSCWPGFEANENIKVYQIWSGPILFLKQITHVAASIIYSFFLDFDMVCAVMDYPALAAFFIKKLRKKPYVIFAFNEIKSWLRVKTKKFGVFRNFYKKIYNEAKYLRVISPTLSQQFTELGIEKDKIRLVFAGVDLKKFRIMNLQRNPLRIITVSRFDKLKGINYLIEAIPNVLKKFPLTEFVLIGDGPARKELEILIDNLGIEKNIFLTGWLDQEKITRELNQSSIFVMPSLSEGLCLAIIEAMACGCAVIGTKVGGIVNLIRHNETGLLVPLSDSSAIADSIINLLNNKILKEKITKNSLNFVKDFDWNDLSAEVKKLFI